LDNQFFFKKSQAKPEDTLDLSRFLNDDLAKTVSGNPDRFIGLGTLPIQAPELGNNIRFRQNLGLSLS